VPGEIRLRSIQCLFAAEGVRGVLSGPPPQGHSRQLWRTIFVLPRRHSPKPSQGVWSPFLYLYARNVLILLNYMDLSCIFSSFFLEVNMFISLFKLFYNIFSYNTFTHRDQGDTYLSLLSLQDDLLCDTLLFSIMSHLSAVIAFVRNLFRF
jgi:hypothetical protein